MPPLVLSAQTPPPFTPPVRIGVSDLPIFRKNFTIASGTSNQEFLPAQAGFVQRIIGYYFHCGATATTLLFESITTGTNLLEILELAANEMGGALPQDREGVMLDAELNEGIKITSGTGSTITGFARYIKIPVNRFSLDNAGAIIGWNDGSPYVL